MTLITVHTQRDRERERQDEAGADDKLLYVSYNGPALPTNDNGKRVVMTPDFLPIVFL